MVLVCAAMLSAARPGAQGATLESVLTHAAWYTVDFVDRFSNVVSEERYVQEAVTTRNASGALAPARTSARRRELRSDFLLVKPPDSPEWQPFRDVFEVDGRAIRDREQRLEKLFLNPTVTAMEQARAIANESARYNLGNVARTINNPVIALAFVQKDNQARFRFRLDKRDADAGAEVWIVEFEETARPTLIRGTRGRDIRARGRMWIDAPSGRVEKTELALNDALVRAKITTAYQLDDRFGIAVPVEMRDEYFQGGTTITGRATYGRFRRFNVTAKEEFLPASPR
jgi:hypothetical protein